MAELGIAVPPSLVLDVGAPCDCRCYKTDEWLEARVIRKTSDAYYIHYVGFSKRHNIWVKFDEIRDRLAPHGMHTVQAAPTKKRGVDDTPATPSETKRARLVPQLGTKTTIARKEPTLDAPAWAQKLVSSMQEIEARLTSMQQMEARLNIRVDRLEARMFNASAVHDNSMIMGFPPSVGEAIPKDFPQTLGELRSISSTMLATMEDTYKYKIPPKASLAQRKALLMRFVGCSP